jgi:hypothetical protein
MSRSAVVQIVIAIMLIGLAACVSPEELRARDEAACARFGFQPGTPDFAVCLQRESLARSYYAEPALSFGFGFGGGRW